MSLSNYAKALFELALEKKIIDEINQHFDDFQTSLEKQKLWIEMMDSPMFHFEQKRKMIDDLAYHPSFLSFLKTLAKKHIMHKSSEIYDEWTSLTRIHQKIAHLHVYSATKLKAEQIERIHQALKPRFPGRTVSLKFSIDPKLIGGIKVIYRGQALDHSVARELVELYTTI